MSDSSRTEKIVKTKMMLAKIKSQNQQGIKTTDLIQGSGSINRDGVPRLPPDQKEVKNWPVLDLGIVPEINSENWKLELTGLCESPQTISYEQLLKMPQTEDTSDFHCVTGWSQFDFKWQGVRFSDLAKLCNASAEAKFVSIESYDDYSTNISIEDALKSDVLIVHRVNGAPLAKEHGGPVRMITPQLWAWKGAKWIRKIEFLKADRRGFWEVRGYSNSAIPWLNDRYTADEPAE
jgi:DMSO/TMAO reductase YedYZ molybdopterin-dependent catalytic subunit